VSVNSLISILTATKASSMIKTDKTALSAVSSSPSFKKFLGLLKNSKDIKQSVKHILKNASFLKKKGALTTSDFLKLKKVLARLLVMSGEFANIQSAMQFISKINLTFSLTRNLEELLKQLFQNIQKTEKAYIAKESEEPELLDFSFKLGVRLNIDKTETKSFSNSRAKELTSKFVKPAVDMIFSIKGIIKELGLSDEAFENRADEFQSRIVNVISRFAEKILAEFEEIPVSTPSISDFQNKNQLPVTVSKNAEIKKEVENTCKLFVKSLLRLVKYSTFESEEKVVTNSENLKADQELFATNEVIINRIVKKVLNAISSFKKIKRSSTLFNRPETFNIPEAVEKAFDVDSLIVPEKASDFKKNLEDLKKSSKKSEPEATILKLEKEFSETSTDAFLFDEVAPEEAVSEKSDNFLRPITIFNKALELFVSVFNKVENEIKLESSKVKKFQSIKGAGAVSKSGIKSMKNEWHKYEVLSLPTLKKETKPVAGKPATHNIDLQNFDFDFAKDKDMEINNTHSRILTSNRPDSKLNQVLESLFEEVNLSKNYSGSNIDTKKAQRILKELEELFKDVTELSVDSVSEEHTDSHFSENTGIKARQEIIEVGDQNVGQTKAEFSSLVFSTRNTQNTTIRMQVINRVKDHILKSIKNAHFELKNFSTMKISLSPPQLGRIRIEVITQDQNVNARVFTDNFVVKEIIESGSSDLKNSLFEKGFTLGTLEVFLGEKHDGRQNRNYSPKKFKGGKLLASSTIENEEELPLQTRVWVNQKVDYWI